MQCAVIEFARNVLNLKKAHSTEFNKKTPHKVVDIMEAQKTVKEKGGTMRLGAYSCALKPSSLAKKIYGKSAIKERHRHRYEFNPKYMTACAKKGLITSGIHKKMNLPEMVELKNHPWFLAVQFHPEFKSRPLSSHPLFDSFIRASIKQSKTSGKRKEFKI